MARRSPPFCGWRKVSAVGHLWGELFAEGHHPVSDVSLRRGRFASCYILQARVERRFSAAFAGNRRTLSRSVHKKGPRGLRRTVSLPDAGLKAGSTRNAPTLELQ